VKEFPRGQAGNTLFIFDSDHSKCLNFVDGLNDNEKSRVRVCSSAFELAASAAFVCLSLPSKDIVESVLFGETGITAAAADRRAGVHQKLTVLEHSTLSRQCVLSCAALAEASKIDYIDAPVSGGPQVCVLGLCQSSLSFIRLTPQGAADGTLTVMAGGDKAIVDRCIPVMKQYASKIFRVGDVG
jgi:3-hydroxyisobutyrate dehydrogenase-like beta-hydroxyacid dehydrogenase